ncbi:serine/arginine repetitive matrix protein 5-like [Haliaeetus albicilla]|uniref:serine/arginine repetitive matrix protein 5-like n=1 Tax=Haliaeetus albicilla TaxID=8969 RepID=UPI0037E874EA
MGLEEDSAEQGTPSPAAPLDASEDSKCPICLDTINDEAYMIWCKHRFCFPCVQNWARIKAECPVCRQPAQYVFRKLAGNNYEVHSVMRMRSQRLSAERRSPEGRQQRSSPSRNRGGGHTGAPERGQSRSLRQHQDRGGGHTGAPERGQSRSLRQHQDRGGGHTGAPERGQSRSPRQHQDGHRGAQHTQGYNSLRSGTWQQRRARDAAQDDGRVPRPEQDVLPSSSRSQLRLRAGRDSSRQQQATRSQSQRRSPSTGGQAGWECSRAHSSQERWRSRDPNDGRAPRSERDVLPCSRRSQSRRGSPSTGGQAGWERSWAHRSRQRWRSRDPDDEGRAPRSEWDVLPSSRRSRSRHRSRSTGGQAGWECSQAHRSRGQWRSRDTDRPHVWERQQSRSPRRGQQVQTGHPGTAAHDSMTGQGQKRSRDPNNGRAPRSEQDVPVFSGRSQRRPRAGRDSSRQRRATRSRSRRRSRSTGGQAGWEQSRAHSSRQRWRSRFPDSDGRAPRPERDVLPSSRRSQCCPQAGWDSSRQRRATRSRSRRRSRSTGGQAGWECSRRSRSRRRTRSRARRGAW